MTADTGCQSVLVGIKIIHRLGFKKSDLKPVKTKMSAVNRDVIPILGAVILRLSGKSVSGKIIETAQICYVTDVIEGAFLSRKPVQHWEISRATSRESDQPLSNPCQSVQLQQAHATRSATAPAPYAPSRHHYQLLYHSQQRTPTGPLSRIGY